MRYINLYIYYIIIATKSAEKCENPEYDISLADSNNVTLATNKYRASSFELRVDWRRTINKGGAIKICA